MRLLQLYYTSCRQGITAGAGFQTLAMSPGITEDERREIERIGVYIPSLSLPSQPTAEEMDQLFPVAFTFFRLTSGRFGVCQSKYTGQDYSGRFGNYFCHALVLENGLWPVYPIALFRSTVFKDSIESIGTIDSGSSRELATLVFDPSMAGQAVTFETVADFLADGDRLQKLSEILQAVINHGTDRRRIVLGDDHRHIPLWFGAIHFSLPLKLAHHISFTTYTHDPETIGAVMTSTAREGSRFSFTKMQTDFQYYIFHLHQHGDSSLVQGQSKLWLLAKTAFAYESKPILDDFHDFIAEFSYDAVDQDIDNAVLLYNLVRRKSEPLYNEELSQAIAFARKYKTSLSCEKLMEKLTAVNQGQSKLDLMSDNMVIEVACQVVPFFFEAAAHSRSTKNRAAVFDVFFHTFSHYISQNISDQSLLAYYDTAKKTAHEQGWAFHQLLMDRIGDFQGRFNDQEPEQHSGFLFRLLLAELTGSLVPWKALSPGTVEFLRGRMSFLVRKNWDLTPCFAILAGAQDIRYLAELLSAGDNAAQAGIQRLNLFAAFTKALRDLSEQEACRVREKLYHEPSGTGPNLLEQEYIIRVAKETDLRRPFWDYYQVACKDITPVSAGHLGEVVCSFVDAMEKNQVPYRFDECYKLLTEKKLIENLTDSQLETIIRVFEKNVFQAKRTEELLQTLYVVHKLKTGYGIETKPDAAFLMLAPMWPKNEHPQKEWTEDKLAGIDEKSFSTYLDWSLPLYLKQYQDADDQFRLFDWICSEGYEKLVLKKYYHAVEVVLHDSNDKKRYKLFSNFLVMYLQFASNPHFTAQQVIAEQLLTTLADSKELSEKVERELQVLRPHYDRQTFSAIDSAWQKLKEKVEEKRSKTFMGRLKGLFSRSEKNGRGGKS